MDHCPTDVMEMARRRLGVEMESPNLFLVPLSLRRLSADKLCRIVCESLYPEFPTHVFQASLPGTNAPPEETVYACIAIDSSRPERVKDIIKERLWTMRDNEHVPVSMRDILGGGWGKKASEFRLEDYGFFVSFRTSRPTGIRTHSFHHKPTFYRYRVALAQMPFVPEVLREYLRALFTSCPNHLFNQGMFRASGVRDGLLDLDISVERTCHHELVALARESRGFEKVKSRHENVQKFLLEQDPSMIASEVPVWVEPWEIDGYSQILKANETLTGHIDVLRLENDEAVGVWDYKPNAAGERGAGVQVFLYALMLSLRTGLPLTSLICGYFDEESAYVFRPSEVRLTHGV